MSELLHPIAMKLDALAMLSDCQAAASDRETARCTLAVVCCESPLIRRFSRWNVKDCTRCWDRRMHWRFCLLPEVLLAKLSVDADETSHACWSCRLTDWLQDKLLSIDCSIEMPTSALDRVLADLTTRKLDRAKCWLVWNVQMNSLNVSPIWKNRSSRDPVFIWSYNSSWIAELLPPSLFCRNQMKSIARKANSIQQRLWTAVRTLNVFFGPSECSFLHSRFWRWMCFSSKK